MKLSQGRWHEQVPRELNANLRFRRKLLLAAENDADVQHELVRRCKNDILFFINTAVFQFNPSKSIRGNEAVHPFITYPFQDRALLATPETHAAYRPYDRGILWCYENDKTMACEKSRWQGASWLFLIFQDWLCLFHDYVQTLNISRNENAVDDGGRNSLFWKLRYIHDRLPAWMTGEILSQKLYFHFHSTQSEATGEASTAKAGVGGRASVIFVDEYPEIEKAEEVRQKTALTANCRYFNGTHLGVGTALQRMCDPKVSPEIVQWRMHWTDHPDQSRGLYEFDPKTPGIPKILDREYDFPPDYPFVLDGTPTGGPRPGVRSPWYDQKSLDMGDSRAVAMNLDISPEGAARQFFDGLKIRNIIQESARPPLWVGDIRFDRRGDFVGLSESKTGRLRLWVNPMGNDSLPTARYCLGADVSAGTGATPSCVAIINGDTSQKIGEYSNPHIVEDEFAQVTSAIGQLARWGDGNPAYLGWDGLGQQGKKFENSILGLGYRHIYYNDEDKVDITSTYSRTRRPGWFGTNAQKYALLVDYRQALYERVLIDRSEECLLETLLFEYDRSTNTVKHAKETRSNDPSGARENHGDMVIATGIAWMLAKDMADGGRRSVRVATGAVEPNSLEWLLALQKGRERYLEEAY